MTIPLVDFHCHLDLYPRVLAAISAAESARVYTLAVTTTPRAWPLNRDLTAHLKHVRPALGLHPQLVETHADELSLWDNYLPQARYIGEVGLDASPNYVKSLDLQKRVFSHILQACARVGGKVLTVHSVRSTTPVLDHIAAHLPPDRGKVVLHWFTGSLSEARRAVEMGCYFSVNANMGRSRRQVALLRSIPLNRLLTETDGPFTSIDGRPTVPADVGDAITALAAIHGISAEEMARQILTNFRELVA
jgi:TatD DNase family protein